MGFDTNSWKKFLKYHGYYYGPIANDWADNLTIATKRFQQDNLLEPTGSLDEATAQKATDLASRELPQFQFGPDLIYDIRECRPYFLVPIIQRGQQKRVQNHVRSADPSISKVAIKRRIQKYVQEIETSLPKDVPPLTDVFIFSHGWRRNFYAAAGGYDRLISRYSRLLHAGYFDNQTQQPSCGKNFRPLFINLHWNSDTGEDEFVDKSGRRDKQSFLRAITTAFEPRAAGDHLQMINDFEDMFEHFSELTAPDTKALSGDHFTVKAEDLIARLDRYDLTTDKKVEADLEVDHNEVALKRKRGEKAAIAWTCYHEADTRRVLVDQDQKPQEFFKGLQAWEALWKFFIAIAGILALVPVLQIIIKNITSYNARMIRPYADRFLQLLHIKVPLSDGVLTTVAGGLLFLSYCLIGGILGAAILWGQDAIQNARNKDSRKQASKGYPILMLMAWLPLQLICTLPALLVLGTTFLVRRFTDLFPLFDERFGNRDEPGTSHMPVRIRPSLARFMLKPVKMLRKVIGQDSSVNGALDQIEGIASFYEMQQRGVQTGEEAAEFIKELFQDVNGLKNARIHLIGHSFGALVVANMARKLALRKHDGAALPISKIDTLCLLQGALGSAWFEGEQKLAMFVKRIGCIYSVYDTANGFIYPFANASRLAAGAVGLTYVGAREKPITPVTRGKFVLLVKPPNLDDEKYCTEENQDEQKEPKALESKQDQDVSTPARVYNLDASRIVYQGAPATGGGHMDIYKDDVVNCQRRW